MTIDLETTADATPAARSVLSVWARVTGEAERDTHPRVPPDGCADIIWIAERAPIVVGPSARFLIPDLPPRTLLSGVRIRPGAAASLLGHPAEDLRDRSVLLGDLWSDCDTRQWSRVAESSSAEDRVKIIQQLLNQRTGSTPPPDPLVSVAVQMLEQNPSLNLDALSDQIGLGPRQLRRRFNTSVGFGPKAFARVMRLQSLIRQVQSNPGHHQSLAGIALDLGYADQAHLTREVRALMGIPPTTLLMSLAPGAHRHASMGLAQK